MRADRAGLLGAVLAGAVAILRLQGALPSNPLRFGGAPWNVTSNTTSSFITNTNWQYYGGETTMSFFSQTAGLAVQNFASQLQVNGEERHGYRILRMESSAVPNAIAAVLLHLRALTGKRPHICFDWTEGNPVAHLLRFLFFGSGEVAVGTPRRWRWTFWLILVAFLAGVLRVPVAILQLAGVMPANAAHRWHGWGRRFDSGGGLHIGSDQRKRWSSWPSLTSQRSGRYF